MKIKDFAAFVKLNETSLSSDWDADYGLSQGPIDSDTKLNVDLTPGLFATDMSEYDFESEEEEEPFDADHENNKKGKDISLSQLKSLVLDLVDRVNTLEKQI